MMLDVLTRPENDLLPGASEGRENGQDDCRVEAITCHHLLVSVAEKALQTLDGGLAVALDGRRVSVVHPAAFAKVESDPDGRVRFRARLPCDVSEAKTRPVVEISHAASGAVLPNGRRKPLPVVRKARALVLIPAGSRYDHDKIRIHSWPMDRIIGTYVNIGDLMVYDSTLKMLDFETVEVGNISTFTDKDVDRYNSEFDFAFLRGSNFIHEYMQWQRAGELLERLKIPVFAIGVGAQAESRRVIDLPAESRRVWSAIADHCGTIGVRGDYSADILAGNGIRNVDVVGCPSVFRTRNPDLKLNLKAVYDVHDIAFSLRRETSANYARDMKEFVDIQKRFMLRLDNEARMTVTLHGEPEEKAFFFRDSDRVANAIEALRASGWFEPDTEEHLLQIYRNRLFFNTSVDQYDAFIRTQDLAIGYRVHGILPGLANGTPGILVNYDERSAELALTHRIPLVDEAVLAKGASWRDIYSPELFKPFIDAYPVGYATMRNFLDRNGVPHRL